MFVLNSYPNSFEIVSEKESIVTQKIMHIKSVSLDISGTVISVCGPLFKKQFTVKYGFRHGASG